MKTPMKAKRAPKRDLFAELSEGMTALAQVRQGKQTATVRGSGNTYRDFTRTKPGKRVQIAPPRWHFEQRRRVTGAIAV